MRKHFVPVLICLLALSLFSFAQPKKSTAKQTASSGPVPDKAFMQKVLDGWSTLDPADAAKFYNHSAGPFFDITPLKYDTWDDYENGVRKILADYQSIKFTANDDAVVHVNGDCAWGTATVKEDALLKSGKREMATLRWTVIWEKQNGQWLVVHDHTSEPLQ